MFWFSVLVDYFVIPFLYWKVIVLLQSYFEKWCKGITFCTYTNNFVQKTMFLWHIYNILCLISAQIKGSVQKKCLWIFILFRVKNPFRIHQYSLERSGFLIPGILFQHLWNVLYAVGIAWEFVATLCVVYCLAAYLVFALLDKSAAYAVNYR